MAPRTPAREPWRAEPSTEGEATPVERQRGLRPVPKQEVIAANHRLAIYDQGSQIGPVRGFKVGWTSRNREMRLREDMHADLVEHMRALLQANLAYDLWQINEYQRHEGAMAQIKNFGQEHRALILDKITSHAFTTKQVNEVIEVLETGQEELRKRNPAVAAKTEAIVAYTINTLASYTAPIKDGD